MLSGIFLCFVYICIHIVVSDRTFTQKSLLTTVLLAYIVVSDRLFTVVITIWLTVTENSYLKRQWIFYFLRRSFLSSITSKTFTGLYSITVWVSYKKQELLALREHLSSPFLFWWGPCCSYCSFLYCPIMCIRVLSSVLWCPLRFQHKNDIRFVFTPSCFLWRLLSNILCVFVVHNGIHYACA
jgi:hypothetical protein